MNRNFYTIFFDKESGHHIINIVTAINAIQLLICSYHHYGYPYPCQYLSPQAHSSYEFLELHLRLNQGVAVNRFKSYGRHYFFISYALGLL